MGPKDPLTSDLIEVGVQILVHVVQYGTFEVGGVPIEQEKEKEKSRVD